MAKLDKTTREAGEDDTINVTATEITDPLLASSPQERNYTKYNADIKTDIPGQIPDIPEPEQQRINVDFTEGSERPFSSDDSSGPYGDEKGSSGEAGDSEDSEKTTVDFTKNEKLLMAQVITSMGIEGLSIVNDLAVDKLLINENHVRDRILEGTADPGLLTYKFDIGTRVIDIQEILKNNRQEALKSLTFPKEDQKRFSELVALWLKNKNVELTPGEMIVAMLIERYGIGLYNIYKLRTDTQDLLDKVNTLLVDARERNQMPGASINLEEKEKEKETKSPRGPRVNAKKKASAVKNDKQAPSNPEGGNEPDPAGEPVAEIRDTEELKDKPSTRRPKRTVNQSSLNSVAQDVHYEEVK